MLGELHYNHQQAREQQGEQQEAWGGNKGRGVIAANTTRDIGILSEYSALGLRRAHTRETGRRAGVHLEEGLHIGSAPCSLRVKVPDLQPWLHTVRKGGEGGKDD